LGKDHLPVKNLIYLILSTLLTFMMRDFMIGMISSDRSVTKKGANQTLKQPMHDQKK